MIDLLRSIFRALSQGGCEVSDMHQTWNGGYLYFKTKHTKYLLKIEQIEDLSNENI